MKTRKAVTLGLALSALALVAAAAQVSRQEFDALRAELAETKQALGELRIRIIALEHRAKASEAEPETKTLPPDAEPKSQKPTAPTAFEALKAWNIAKAGAQEKWASHWDVSVSKPEAKMVRPTERGYQCLVPVQGRNATTGGRPLGWENKRAVVLVDVERTDEGLAVKDMDLQIVSE